MIIDLILDRVNGKPYVPADFYRSVAEYGTVFQEIVFPITAALDGGAEADVQRVLCEYIERNDYNPELCGYVRSVKWLEPDTLPLNPICIDCKVRGVTCDGTTCQAWTGCIYHESN